jgi:endonuclease/exonuclease/phosphatase family metal-dependent hydrolase
VTLAAHVDVPELGPLLFIATTTSWRPDAEAARERQAVTLTDIDARQRTRAPTILAGDFTAGPDSACLRYLHGRQSLAGRSVHYHDAWELAGERPGHTWTSENPNARGVIDQVLGAVEHRARVDHILIGSRLAHPQARCRVLRAQLAFDIPIDGVWASDHFGVVADLDLSLDAE